MKTLVKLSLAVAVLFFVIVPVQFSFADWSKDMKYDLDFSKPKMSIEKRPLMVIDEEIQSNLSQMMAISEKYRAFAQELGYITPMNYKSACTKLKNLNPGNDIAQMQKKAVRVIDLLRDAQNIVNQGEIPPKRLGEILSDWGLPSAMEELIRKIEESRGACKF